MNNYLATLLLAYFFIAVMGYAYSEGAKYEYMKEVVQCN